MINTSSQVPTHSEVITNPRAHCNYPQLPAKYCKLVLSNNALQFHEVGRPHARHLDTRIVNTSADWQWVKMYYSQDPIP